MKLSGILGCLLMAFMAGIKVEANEFDLFFYFYIVWGGIGVYNLMYNRHWRN